MTYMILRMKSHHDETHGARVGVSIADFIDDGTGKGSYVMSPSGQRFHVCETFDEIAGHVQAMHAIDDDKVIKERQPEAPPPYVGEAMTEAGSLARSDHRHVGLGAWPEGAVGIGGFAGGGGGGGAGGGGAGGGVLVDVFVGPGLVGLQGTPAQAGAAITLDHDGHARPARPGEPVLGVSMGTRVAHDTCAICNAVTGICEHTSGERSRMHAPYFDDVG